MTDGRSPAEEPPARPGRAVHLMVAGGLHVAFGAMGVLGGVMLALSGRTADGAATATLLGPLLGVASAVGVAAGIGLLRGAGWARIALIAVAVVYLLDLPLGTALGAYSLWVLLHPGIPDALSARRK